MTFVALVGDRSVEYIAADFDPGGAVTAAPAELAGMIARHGDCAMHFG